MTRFINVATCNFEKNGKGDRSLWEAMHKRLRSLNLQVLFRQEMWGANDDDNELADAAERVLELEGRIGERCCTAVYTDPAVFAHEHHWPLTGGMWVQPPAAHAFRYLPAGDDAPPLVAVSYHLNYGSPTLRAAESEYLTTWNDKRWQSKKGQQISLPALFGGDSNSYPDRAIQGDRPLPQLREIEDRPHRAHRSYQGWHGRRIMDSRADETLRTAGMEDVARHLAEKGDASGLAATMDASSTHGPATRVDRIYASTALLPAVSSVEVIDMTGLSDHHTVLLKLDYDVLADVLRSLVQQARSAV
ncbi:endonuclease/exonuclease/phosphatase family protein [Streptomyces sparsogenes]|uniref:endonuclease/exonuclease/phosphatase family protein n=1 Tax=Streptomyces sparsogenes TaxID=67365 RepID=UPI0033D8BA3C